MPMYKRDVFFNFALPISINVVELKDSPMLFYQEYTMAIIVLSGNIKIRNSGRERQLFEKEMLLVDRDSPVKLTSAGRTSVILILNINNAHYKEQFFSINCTVFADSIKDPHNVLLSQILDVALGLIENNTKAYSLIDNTIQQILKEALNNHQVFSPIINSNYSSMQTRMEYIDLMQNILYYIDNNYSEKLSLKTFAAQEHLNGNYLSHLIRKISGTTFKEMTSLIRCRKSELYLVDSFKKINEIAYLVGFSSPAYYKNSFLKFYGITPEEYRTDYQGKKMESDAAIYDKSQSKNIFRIFAHKHQVNITMTAERFFTVDTIFIDRCLEKYSNVLSDEGKIHNIDAEMNENIHQAFDNMQKEFRMTRITIDVAILIENADSNSKLTIARNINYLIHAGFRVVFVFHYLSKQYISVITEFMVFYSRRFKSCLNEIEFSFKVSASKTDPLIYRKMLLNKLDLEIGMSFDVEIDHRYFSREDYAPPLYDSFILPPFAMDELFNEKNWAKTIDFALIDSVNKNGNIMSGGKGLLTWNGIKKPWWNAYMLVSKLSGNIISRGKDHIVTNNNGQITILTYNTCGKQPSFLKTIKTNEQLFDVVKNHGYIREHCFQLRNVFGSFKQITYSIDASCCLFTKWAKLGYPNYLTSEEENVIEQICHPRIDFDTINADGHFDITIKEGSFGVSCVVMEKIK